MTPEKRLKNFAESQGWSSQMLLVLSKLIVQRETISRIYQPTDIDRFLADYCEMDSSSVTSCEELYKTYLIAGGCVRATEFSRHLSTKFDKTTTLQTGRKLWCFRGVTIKPHQLPTRQ